MPLFSRRTLKKLVFLFLFVPSLATANPSPFSEVMIKDNRGHLAIHKEAKDNFEKANPCPSTGRASGPCPGWVIDYIVPLNRGGTDTPRNMRWLPRGR